jgi:hypothetical protein
MWRLCATFLPKRRQLNWDDDRQDSKRNSQRPTVRQASVLGNPEKKQEAAKQDSLFTRKTKIAHDPKREPGIIRLASASPCFAPASKGQTSYNLKMPELVTSLAFS